MVERDRDIGDLLKELGITTSEAKCSPARLPKSWRPQCAEWLSPSLKASELMELIVQCSYPGPGPENLGRHVTGVNSGV